MEAIRIQNSEKLEGEKSSYSDVKSYKFIQQKSSRKTNTLYP